MTIEMNIASTRQFGIEIECKGISLQAMCRAIQNAGIACNVEGYGHNVPLQWKVTTDSSVHDGGEVVSPILSGREGLEQVVKVANALAAAGARADRECGFHVHVNARDLSGATLLNCLRRYHAHESTIDGMMPTNRRGHNNSYCRSVERLVTDVCGRLPANVTARILAETISDRYYKLNIAAFMRHGTVEFRQHSGTVSALKMVNWVHFCVNFVEDSICAVVTAPIDATAPVVAITREGVQARKFAIMAQVLDEHVGRMTCISASELATAMGVREATVASYISTFRTRYPGADIQCRRGQGYYRNSETPLVSFLSGPGLTVRTEVPQEQGIFASLAPAIASYFQERTQDLTVV